MVADAQPSPAFAGSNIANVKAHNRYAVLSALLHRGPVSRAALAELTGLSTTTVTNLVAELLGQGIVSEDERELHGRRGAGRPRIPVRLVPGARHAIGIHFDVDNVRVALSNLSGELTDVLVVPHSSHDPAAHLLERAAQLVERALDESGVDRRRVVGVGVGASGLVNLETGVNMLAPNLGWRNLPIGSMLASRLNARVVVENNARAMALAEAMFGAGRNVHSLAFVYARVGVGAGLVVGQRLYRGSGAGAGEIGHTTIIADGGALCRCGNTGCLETLVSEPAIVKLALIDASQHPESLLASYLASGDTPGIDAVFAAARAGDAAAVRLLRSAARYMGTALANLIDIINPDTIILGGLLAAGQDVLLPAIRETVQQRAFAGLGEQVDLRPSTFGSCTGVLGAAALALDTFFYRHPAPPLTAPVFISGDGPLTMHAVS